MSFDKDNPNDDRVRINIFNISKINSDQDSRGTPRVRRMAEYLGQSYFDYLAGLKDLVLIMDEAHRYRASAGMAAINELHPVLGIELTATAKSTGAKGKAFRNIAYEYKYIIPQKVYEALYNYKVDIRNDKNYII